MSTTRLPTSGGAIERPEQLMLLPPTDVPLQFRLDERTRRRGLEHIAQIRRQLAEQAAKRQAPPERRVSHRSAPQRRSEGSTPRPSSPGEGGRRAA
jgi:hypothetical protein